MLLQRKLPPGRRPAKTDMCLAVDRPLRGAHRGPRLGFKAGELEGEVLPEARGGGVRGALRAPVAREAGGDDGRRGEGVADGEQGGD